MAHREKAMNEALKAALRKNLEWLEGADHNANGCDAGYWKDSGEGLYFVEVDVNQCSCGLMARITETRSALASLSAQQEQKPVAHVVDGKDGAFAELTDASEDLPEGTALYLAAPQASQPVALTDSQIARAVYAGPNGVRALLAAQPSAERAVVAYLVDGRIEQGLTFEREAAETMAEANCGNVVPLCRCTCQPSAEAIRREAWNEAIEAAAELFPQPYMEYFGSDIQDAIRALAQAPKGE